MKTRRALLLVWATAVIAAFVSPLVASAQGETDLSGTWDWTDHSNQTNDYSGPATIVHNVAAGTFTWEWDGSGPDSSAHVTANGTVSGTSLQMNTDEYQGLTSQFQGQILENGNRLEGTWTQSDGQDGTFIAIRQGSSPSPSPSATTECNDHADNDEDGLIDYPSDFGCSSASDTTETGRFKLKLSSIRGPKEEVDVGETQKWEIKVVNKGPDVATDSIVTVDSSGEFSQVVPTHGSCLPLEPTGGDDYQCNFGHLSKGASARIAMEWRHTSPTDLGETGVEAHAKAGGGSVEDIDGRDSLAKSYKVLGLTDFGVKVRGTRQLPAIGRKVEYVVKWTAQADASIGMHRFGVVTPPLGNFKFFTDLPNSGENTIHGDCKAETERHSSHVVCKFRDVKEGDRIVISVRGEAPNHLSDAGAAVDYVWCEAWTEPDKRYRDTDRRDNEDKFKTAT